MLEKIQDITKVILFLLYLNLVIKHLGSGSVCSVGKYLCFSL